MFHLLIVDSDRLLSQKLADEISSLVDGVTVVIAYTASEAVEHADKQQPNAVLLELSLTEHSGMEFLYEFRSYADWQNIPIAVYTTVLLSDEVLQSLDWRLLNIDTYFYKPKTSIQQLAAWLEDLQA